MPLQEFLKEKTTAEMHEFAEETGIRYGTLHSIRCGERKAGMEVFNKLNNYAPQLFTAQFVRPDYSWSQ